MRRLTRDEFIRRSRAVHGNKYDYSQSEIASATIKVVIICPEHGPFEQAPSSHYSQGCGCPPCAGKRTVTLEDMKRHAADKGGSWLLPATDRFRWLKRSICARSKKPLPGRGRGFEPILRAFFDLRCC